jgi:chromosome partitioning protein
VQIITIGNQKGGTAKTATAAAIAQAGAAHGLKVLAIDLDPQANLSFALRADTRHKGSYELLEGEPARQTIQETAQGIDTIASSRNLATVTTTTGSAKRLQRALQPIKGIYDLIVIDTPPTAGELLYNALQASTGLVIPLLADIFGLQGLYQIADTAKQFKQSNPGLQVKGFVLTRYDNRSSLTKAMKANITAKAAELGIPCLAEIREGVAIREAAALQQSLFEYAPKSKPAQDYMKLYEMIMEG